MSPRLANRNIVIVGVVALVLLTGVGTLFLLAQNSLKQKTSDDSGALGPKSPAYVEKTQTILRKADQTNDSTKVAAAEKELKQLVAGTKAEEELIVYYGGLTDLYSLKGDYSTALKYALEAEAQLHTYITAANVGFYYAKLGQHAKSAEYYRLAMSRTEKVSDPTLRAPYNDYRIRAAEEEAKS